MVRAWYMADDGFQNPRDEHQRLPPEFITLEDLYKVTGVEYYQLDVAKFETDGSLDKIKNNRGYQYEDQLLTPDGDNLTKFYTEHLHQDEEIRFVLEGCGYYDVRDKNDEWIRIEVMPGDLIVIPSGCYHRFMLDKSNLFKAIRLFFEEPVYKAFNRPAEEMDCRQTYIKKLKSGAFEIPPSDD